MCLQSLYPPPQPPLSKLRKYGAMSMTTNCGGALALHAHVTRTAPYF